MIRRRLTILMILVCTVCLVLAFFYTSYAIAFYGVNPNYPLYMSELSGRTATWPQTQYDISSLGGLWMVGQLGQYVGFADSGIGYPYNDPLTGPFISYSNPALGGLLNYKGMFSTPFASYAPYSGGIGLLQTQTQYLSGSGNLLGGNTGLYRPLYNPTAEVMGISTISSPIPSSGFNITGGYAGYGFAVSDGDFVSGYGVGGFGTPAYGNTTGYGYAIYDGDELAGYAIAVFSVTP